MLKIEDTGILWTNPYPHLRAAHAWHPTLTRVGDELVVALDIGQAVEAFDYRTYICRSIDGGSTWSKPEPLWDDPTPGRYNNIFRIRAMADGTLTALGARIHRLHDDSGFVNHETFGYAPTDLICLTSDDAGRTWTGGDVKTPLPGPFELCHPIIELSDGRWLAPMSTWKAWDGAAAVGMKAIAFVSHDRGRTWPEYSVIADDWQRGVMNFEITLAELPDRRLLAVTWRLDGQSGLTEPSCYTLSDAPGSLRFGSPRPTGFLAQTAKLVALPDGHILVLYRSNDPARRGLWANLARIRGDAWESLADLPAWKGAASGMTGTGLMGQELAELKFGFPSLLHEGDNRVLAVFWCRENEQNQIRWIRMSVEK